MIIPVIIAGGQGTRLWPASDERTPKPFLDLFASGESLFQATLRRAAMAGGTSPMVVCSEMHAGLVEGQAAAAGIKLAQLILEPIARNTAPAVCVAAVAILRRFGAGAKLLVMPADHDIRRVDEFVTAVLEAGQCASSGRLMTFAIAPDSPSSAYGYLRMGAALGAFDNCHEIAQFVEKPDRARAEAFLASGGYAWNSGMFVFSAETILSAFRAFAPDILAACEAALPSTVDGGTVLLDKESFAAAPAISVDYAIMEKAANVAAVKADLGWSDVGDWDAVHALSHKDALSQSQSGNVESIDCSGSLLLSDGPYVAAIGLHDIVAVASHDAVLIAPRARAQEVRRAAELHRSRRSEIGSAAVMKPWGWYRSIHAGPGFHVKELCVTPGGRLSLQRHKFRAEHWVCTVGRGVGTCDGKVIPLSVDQEIYIPMGAVHRLENPFETELRIIEVQIGAYTGEDDIERLEDIYGRVKEETPGT